VNVPLFAEGELVGALNLATFRNQPFTAEEQSLLMAIAYQLGTAIANARLRQEAIEAERLAVVGRLAAGVAHDLRSPLGGILRSAEFLKRTEISQETRDKLIHAIISLARRLISTSQGILDFIHGEEIPLRLTPTSLSNFLNEVLVVLQIDFSDRGIEVIQDFGVDTQIVMDADRMAQVVFNLAENARDAMPRGGKFTIQTLSVGKHVELRFTDTGSGIPSELHERVFEPFFTYGKFQGAGLGLAIAKQIVEEHGGTIHLDSADDKGTTFTISLPT
jgi:signal transduction histidine kinase